MVASYRFQENATLQLYPDSRSPMGNDIPGIAEYQPRSEAGAKALRPRMRRAKRGLDAGQAFTAPQRANGTGCPIFIALSG